MTTRSLKSYIYVIVALASIVGSIIASPLISNFVGVIGSDRPPLIPNASAVSFPFTVDHHIKIKEKVSDPVRLEEWMNDADRNCEMSCTYVEYRPGSQGKAGLAYVADSPVDLSDAKRVHFFLMGDKGGEMVKVKIAGKNPSSGQKADTPFKEKFAKSSNVITLSNDWQRYEIPLGGVDLKGIVAPFAIELLKGKGSANVIVYLKYIVYDKEPVDERFLLTANATGNVTTANNTAVVSNNTQGLRGENVQGNNSRGSRTTPTADTPEAENNNNSNSDNETATSTTDNAADTISADQISNSIDITAPIEGQDNENSAPIAMLAVDGLVAHPGDKVILDGSRSNDPDGDEITYYWSKSDGPSVSMMNANTSIPTVTIPMVNNHDVITIDLVVSDGQTESNKASVVIDVQHREVIEGAIEKDLLPDDNIGGQGWSGAACGSNSVIVDCLTDSSDTTFVSSDSPDRTTYQLFSFQEFADTVSAGSSSSNNIAYVTAQIIAKKTGASGFISLLIDGLNNEEHYSTPSISVISDSFEEYSFNWKFNPITGRPWTADSLNSLVAGYSYSAGQSSIEISEFKLIVIGLIGQEEQEISSPSSSAIDEDSGATADDDNNNNDTDLGNSTTRGAEEATRTDSDNAIDEDVPKDNV
jgi:hypothetical protein